MTIHTRPAKGAVLAAFSCATVLAACKSNDIDEISDPRPEWEIRGAVDPDSIPEPMSKGMSGVEFLEMNKDKDGVVVLPSGLQYRIIDTGNGEKPGLEDSVLVHYKMINLDGEVVENSRNEGDAPQSFRVVKVIGGWREALLRMTEGSRWKLYVPPDLGYGSTGVLAIGSNEVLIYEIELFKVKKTGPPSSPDLGADGDVSLDPLD